MDVETQDRGQRDSRPGARAVLELAPGVTEEIRKRMEEFPEYRVWLQQFGQDVLRAVD